MIVNEYFQSYEDYFWHWEDNAEVVAIPDHSTIAYRAFIKEVLEKLSEQGVPPFGALLAVMIATNPQGEGALDFIWKATFEKEIEKENNHYLIDAFIFLKLLIKIPEPYKTGNKRILLFQALFENCHNIISVKSSKEIVGLLDWYYSNEITNMPFTQKAELKHTIYSRDFRTISLLASRFKSVEDIIKKIASIPEVTEVVIPSENIEKATGKQTFIEALIDNNKTFQIGILAERIVAGLNIPFHRSLADLQPLGGIADVTNKGSFDKLLLSEFANEDIVFLSRLANNEALYVEREIPPAKNNFKRVFLLDVSLRNWGTPKSIAFATMLAIAKNDKTTVPCSAFAIGRSYNPVALDSIDTLIDGLQVLEDSADAAAGLALYFKDNPPDKNTEVFFLAESSAAKQSAVYNSMYIYGAFIHYCIYTDFDGNIDVYKKQQKSLKHIQHIQLPLEEIWQRKPVVIKSNTRNAFVTTFPILLKDATVKQQLQAPNGDIYQVTSEKALVKKYNRYTNKNDKGWEMIYQNIPFSDGIFEIVELSNGKYLLFIFNIGKKMIVLLNIDTGHKTSLTFNEYKHQAHSVYKEFIYMNDSFYHQNRETNDIWRIGVDGTVELSKPQDASVFTAKKAEKYTLPKQYSKGVFKKINDVYINENNNLVFNKHELLLKNHQYIKLDITRNTTSIIGSTKINPNEFVFNDGSSVEVNRSGMLILKSSNENIPLIYIPSILDVTLGVAAGDDFAGNTYYHKEKQFEIILKNPGSQPLAVVKYIQDCTQMGLAYSKNIVDGWPASIMKHVNDVYAAGVRKELENLGASVEIKAMQNKDAELKTMNPLVFYDKYIQAFINTIQSNGAKH